MSGATNNPATSNAITTTVNQMSTPSISVSGTSTICAGVNSTFTASSIDGGTGPSYQWQVNGNAVGSNSTTFSTTSLTNGATVSCILNSNYACATQTTVNSNVITMTVNPIPATPIVTASAGTLYSSAATGNQWYLNGTIIPGANGQTYTPTTTGTFTVQVNVNSCKSSFSNGYTVFGLGVDELNAANLAIYPNPSTGDFNVSFDAITGQLYTLKIYTEDGKLVYETTIENQQGTFVKQIQLGKVASGLYTISLSNGQKVSNHKLVIK
jgi:hypothetical protein